MDKLLSAMYFATSKHSTQNRKDKITPYISHPLSVALLLSTVTNDEDVIVAGILHDVLEESEATKHELSEIFGSTVADIVDKCSEQDKTLSWSARKEEGLRKIKSMNYNAALVKTADILHNTYDMVQKVREYGVAFFGNFNTNGVSKIKYEQRRLAEFKKYHQNLPFLPKIENNLASLEKSLNINH